MQKQDRGFKPLSFLLDCEFRVKDIEEDIRKQKLYMHIAFAYFDESDYDNALKYFLKSFECDPDSYYLKVSITLKCVYFN